MPLSPEELLFHEFGQQYEQYRHLDSLREKYVAFYIAFISAIFAYISNTIPTTYQSSGFVPYLTLFLLIIGLVILYIAISMRITQRLIADHLMEIRKALISMLPSNKETVCRSYLMLSYSPIEKNNCIQWEGIFKESATLLIGLLIFVNSVVGTYFVWLTCQWIIMFIPWFVIFIVFVIIQMLIFISKFESAFSLKRIKQRKKDACKYLQNVCSWSDQDCDERLS